MPKNIYCGKCGQEILLYRKAIQGEIFDLVEPHVCSDVLEPRLSGDPVPTKLDVKPDEDELKKTFDDLEFVQKLNDIDEKSGDKRPKDVLRKEKETDSSSSAPDAIRNKVRG